MATAARNEQAAEQDGHGQLGELRSLLRQATDARAEYERAASIYTGLTFVESKLEADRHGVKEAAIARLMCSVPDPGDPGEMTKPLSATAAEKAAHTDETYLAHLKLQRETVRDKNNAHTRMESARMRVQISLAAVRSIGGFQ